MSLLGCKVLKSLFSSNQGSSLRSYNWGSVPQSQSHVSVDFPANLRLLSLGRGAGKPHILIGMVSFKGSFVSPNRTWFQLAQPPTATGFQMEKVSKLPEACNPHLSCFSHCQPHKWSAESIKGWKDLLTGGTAHLFFCLNPVSCEWENIPASGWKG